MDSTRFHKRQYSIGRHHTTHLLQDAITQIDSFLRNAIDVDKPIRRAPRSIFPSNRLVFSQRTGGGSETLQCVRRAARSCSVLRCG
jgi:hypothetical protein